jgi:hypothetical protein
LLELKNFHNASRILINQPGGLCAFHARLGRLSALEWHISALLECKIDVLPLYPPKKAGKKKPLGLFFQSPLSLNWESGTRDK